MFVKDRMTRDPYTIQVSASINTLVGLMKEKGLRKGRFAGTIFTDNQGDVFIGIGRKIYLLIDKLSEILKLY